MKTISVTVRLHRSMLQLDDAAYARRMAPGQSVVTPVEIAPTLAEIGTVQVAGASDPAAVATPGVSLPLQQIGEAAVISGVCVGPGRCFGLNGTALRIFAVLLLSGGGVIPVCLALMLLVPYAPRERDDRPLGWLPGNCRGPVEYPHARQHLATS